MRIPLQEKRQETHHYEFDSSARSVCGNDTFELPVPATYVVNTDGVIVHGFVNVDYTQREEPEKIVAVLKQLQVSA